MEDEEVKNSISRRRIMKRAGVGAAIVWSAPVLTSLGSAAHAQTPPDAACTGCSGPCLGQVECGASGECLCANVPAGGCGCYVPGLCRVPEINCTSAADCASGEICVQSCCATGDTGVCRPPCGSAASVTLVPGQPNDAGI